MKKWIRRFLVYIGIPLLVGLLLEYLKEYPFFSTLWSAIVWCWDGVLFLANIQVSLWAIILGLLIVIVLGCLFKSIKINTRPEPKPDAPFLSYKEDVFDNFPVRWAWVLYSDGYSPKSITVCCPNDKTPLIFDYYYYKCPRCKKEYHQYPDNGQIDVLIRDNAIRGNFNKSQA